MPIVEALPTTELPKYMAIRCAAAERGGLIKKKEKKESSWVMLKVFRPTGRGHNNIFIVLLHY